MAETLTRHQERVLRNADRSIGGFTTLLRSEALSAQALERRGLGTYVRTDEHLAFTISAAGKAWLKGK